MGTALDHLTHQLSAEAAPSVLGQDIDVREVHECHSVGERPRESDLPLGVVQADDPLRLAHETLHDLARPSLRPVGLIRQEVMDGVDVDAGGVVVEHETVLELAAHARSLAGPHGTEDPSKWNAAGGRPTRTALKSARS